VHTGVVPLFSLPVRGAQAFGRTFAAAARSKRPSDWVAIALVMALVAGGAIVTGWTLRYGLAVNRLTLGVGDLVFYGGDGKAWFRMNEQRRDVPLDRISPHLRHAVIAVEDQRFRYHPGIDPIGLGRAVVNNLRAGARREGGSTITQQLARTLYLSNARTWGRKGKEAVLACMLELRLSKDQILELYLNRVYLSAGIYGVEAMASALFGKPAADLTLGEAALIAGLVQAPSALSPWTNLEGARTRGELVLERMHAQGYITERELQDGRRQRLRVRPHPGIADAKGGYAKEFLRQQFRQQFGGDHPPDWQVHTTVLPAVQDAAERAVADGLRRLGKRDLQAALVALDPATGDLLAIVGGRDYRTTPFNRAARSRRQPGSAFKPFVYAAALSRGFSPVSTVSGLATMTVEGQDEWNPRNATGAVPDELTLREAFIESNNRAAVVLQQEIGTRPVLRLASETGLPDQPNVPSLALGSGLVTPLALTAAYAAFPGGGYVARPRAIRRVLDQQGSVAFERRVVREQVLSPEVAYQMVSLMRDVVDRGTGIGVRAAGIRFPVGAKTGTTNEFKDAWFVGYTSAVVVGVWVGFDQPATIGSNAFGSRVALPIWADFVRRTAKTLQPAEFARPRGLRDEELCRISYLRPVEQCPTYVEYFKAEDQVPGRLCEIHKGSLKQRARRAVEGFFRGVGGKLKDIFR
jgi:1A family penicillin-binding protein